MPARKNQNLTKEESTTLRMLAEFHGLTASTGPYAGKGSAFALQLALIYGDLAVVSIDPDDREALAEWLFAQAQDAPAHLKDLIVQLGSELIYNHERPAPIEPAATPGQTGPINTLEG